MNDEGQAYIATAVALGALLVAMFAAPAITHASLTAGSSDGIGRSVFMDETHDVMRLLEDAVQDATPQATVECTRSERETAPADPPNSTTLYTWDCGEPVDCGDQVLVEEAQAALQAIRKLVQMAIQDDVSLQPGCEAHCQEVTDTDDENYRPSPLPATSAVDVELDLIAPTASASFEMQAFGGPRNVQVTCDNTPP